MSTIYILYYIILYYIYTHTQHTLHPSPGGVPIPTPEKMPISPCKTFDKPCGPSAAPTAAMGNGQWGEGELRRIRRGDVQGVINGYHPRSEKMSHQVPNSGNFHGQKWPK